MKTKLVIANVIAVVFAAGMLQKLSNARADCVDPVNQGPCHTADSKVVNVQCQVNCLCPYNSTINQQCFNSWNITIHTTDSSTSNWGTQSGSTYTSSTPYDADNCYWSVEQATCPDILPGQGCYPTLTYVTAGPGSRMVIDTTGCAS